MKLIVLYRGQHPVRFGRNVQRRIWSLCAEDEATRFESEAEILVAMVDHGMRGQPVEFKRVEEELTT